MILNSGYLDKNSLQDRIIFLDKEFDLVLDVMRPTSREDRPYESLYCRTD